MYIYSSKCTCTACVVSASRELGSHFFRPGLHFFRPGSQSIYSPLSAQLFAGRTAAPPPPAHLHHRWYGTAFRRRHFPPPPRRCSDGRSLRGAVRSFVSGAANPGRDVHVRRPASQSRAEPTVSGGAKRKTGDALGSAQSFATIHGSAVLSLLVALTCTSSTAAGGSRAWRARGAQQGDPANTPEALGTRAICCVTTTATSNNVPQHK